MRENRRINAYSFTQARRFSGMADKQKNMNFRNAIKTLSYFKENLREPKKEASYGKYLQLWTATLIENKKHITVPIALYWGTDQKREDFSASSLNDTLPKLYEFWQKYSNSNLHIPLFIVGHSFDEVFERKLKLLSPCVPDIRMLQYINVSRFFNVKTSIEERSSKIKKQYDNLFAGKRRIENEKHDFMAAMHNYLNNGGELGGKKYDILDWEVQTAEGSKRAEKIDFLAVERSKKWLTVIELKFTDLNDKRLLGSIFQGMDYCNWVEKHKYELAMIYSNHNIHSRHRSRLILINGTKGFPDYYPKIIDSYCSRDKYQEIELYYLKNVLLPIDLVGMNDTKVYRWQIPN
jgi:hypothetical protein